MPRRVPQERKWMIGALKKLAKRKNVGGPTILAALDRIAHLDGLYEVELVRPRERPDRLEAKPVSLPEPAPEPVEDRGAQLLKEFQQTVYGGVNGAAESRTIFTVTNASECAAS